MKPTFPIPHRAMMVLSALLWIAILLFIFTRCRSVGPTALVRTGLMSSVCYTTSDGKYEVCENRNSLEAIRKSDMQDFRGKWQSLPAEVRQSIVETRFHKLDSLERMVHR